MEELQKYPVAVYSHPVIMTEERAELLENYVRQGGTLIIGCRAGYKEEHGHCIMMPQPGLLQKLTGSDVRDFSFANPAEEPIWAEVGGQRLEMPIFNDVLEALEGTEVLATYGNGYFAGSAAITEHRLGNGRTIHVGSAFSGDNLNWLFEYTGIMEPFRETVEAPEEIELVMRKKDGKQYLFLLNFKPEEKTYILKKEALSLYTGEKVKGACSLPPYGTAVYVIEEEIHADR